MVTTYPLLIAGAAAGLLACRTEVERDDRGTGTPSGGTESTGENTNGSGSAGEFNCEDMCSELIAKLPQCNLDGCISNCMGLVTFGETHGCRDDAVACLERFPIDGTDCAAGCTNNEPLLKCISDGTGGQ